MTMSGGLRVSHWEPTKTRAERLRDYLWRFDGTDYGLTDAQLDGYIEQAICRRGGKRLSWHALAADQIRRDVV